MTRSYPGPPSLSYPSSSPSPARGEGIKEGRGNKKISSPSRGEGWGEGEKSTESSDWTGSKFFSICSICIICIISAVSGKPPQELKFKELKFSPPKVEERLLSNGATLYLLPDTELPIINLTAMVRTGTMLDPEEKVGLASLCATLLRAGGTQSRKPEEMDEELEFMGASVESGMDTESASVSLSAMKKDLDRALEIFADVLLHPRFDPVKLKIEKAKLIETIRRRNDEPFQIARREFRKLLYGELHPLSRTAEIPNVQKISRRNLIEFYKRYYHPNNTRIAVSGDFEPEEMVQKLEALLKDWKRNFIHFPQVRRANPESTPSKIVGFVERPLNQATIILGHLGIQRHNPDRFALEVMNEIFGGSSFTSRLYKEVRSRQGLAYWVGSSFSEPYDFGVISAGCQTKNQTVAKSIRSILGEIEKIREKSVSKEELQRAKDSIINSFVFRYENSHSIAVQKMSLDYFGYPQDYLETYVKKIAQVTEKDVQRVARKYLIPEQLNFMVVGQEKDFDEPLFNFGSVQKIDITIRE